MPKKMTQGYLMHTREMSSYRVQVVHGKKKKTPKPEGVDFGKKLIEFTEMEVDEDVEKALNKCKIGFTWFVENAENLQYKLRDIGLVKYKVTSLSDRKFLIRKDKADSWDDLKNTDLSV